MESFFSSYAKLKSHSPNTHLHKGQQLAVYVVRQVVNTTNSSIAEMEKFISVFVIVFLLSTAVQYCSCERFNIIPTADSPCPGEFTGEPCLTLQQYVANPSLSSNITLELHSGNHRLDSQLSVADINSFTMRANATVTVTCSQQLRSSSYEWFRFDRVQQLHVTGITFIGCRMYLWYVTNVTFVRDSFVNKTMPSCCRSGTALYIQSSTSVMIRQCIISNNRGYQTIYGIIIGTFTFDQSTINNNLYFNSIFLSSPYSAYTTNISILNSNFSGNYDYSGVVYVENARGVTIHNTHFNNNRAGQRGGAVYVRGGQVNITNTNFSDNIADRFNGGSGDGGALYITSGQSLNIYNVHFNNNRAGTNTGNGGAVYYDGGNITVTNSTFINNMAHGGGGGALHSVRRYTNITLTNNTFSYNTAAYCGVMDIDEFFHYHVNFTGNTFTYNRAVGLVAGNNGGGVICIRNASISLMDNNFSHNTATGDAGVIRVDESHVTVQRSIFSNNTAGGDGGVFHTYFYPSTYTISHTSFTDNQAGGDGGVMYVGRAGSHVAISQSTFTSNNATNRGGVLAVIGTTVHINGATISDNTAQLGEVVSACNSNVTISNPQISPTQDPVYSFCSLYDSSNETVSRTTPQTPSITDTTTNPLTETATTTQQDSITTTLSPPDEATSTQPTTITTTQPTTAATTNEQTTTPTFTTTEDSVVAMTTTTMEEMSTISPPTTNQITADITTEDGDVTTTTTALEETTTAAMPQTTDEITTTDDMVDTTDTTDTTSTSIETRTTTDDHMTSTSQLLTTPYEVITTTNTETMTEPSVSDVTTKSDVIITSSDELPKETTSTNTDTSTTLSPTTDLPPKQETTTAIPNEEETSTRDSKTDSSDSIPTTIKIITRPADKEQDATQYNPHYIIPGYVAIGVSVVLLIMVVIFGAIIVNKLIQTKSEPQQLNRLDFNESMYPTLKNEYTLPDVHVLST